MSLFKSFFQGGIESSSHKLRNGTRLDMLASTRHDLFYREDYRALAGLGLETVREGIRWHLIERKPGHYDFSSVLPMLRAARELDMQVIWDLCHYGWPDFVDIFKPEFVNRFARMVKAFAQVVKEENPEIAFFAPINEISFFSWGGGDVQYLNPFQTGRGLELKTQLVRATIEATEAIWAVDKRSRIVHVDPIISIVADPTRPEDNGPAQGHHESQFQAWDMLKGTIWPQLGGNPKYLDIIGVNYYHNNQWVHNGPPLNRFHPLYQPLNKLLVSIYKRYNRPLYIAETGIEDDARPEWLAYVGKEARMAMEQGVPLEGICLYPVINHPGWDDDRHCYNGLLDYANEKGQREVFEPLEQELRLQQNLFAGIKQKGVVEHSGDFIEA